jgi:hypothetical protein
MKIISALQEKVFATGLSHSCCMGKVGGTVHSQLLVREVLSSSVCIYEERGAFLILSAWPGKRKDYQ